MGTLKKLEKVIRSCWGRDTCYYKFLWDDKTTPESSGHCRVVALIVQDSFGGEILYTYVKGNKKWDHYFNRLPSGKEVDLTRDQFPKNIKLVKPKVITRKEALEGKRMQRTYRLLKRRVKSILL